MKENIDEKSLLKINENSVFYKIKQFFRKLLQKKEITNTPVMERENNMTVSYKDKRNMFLEEIKKVEDEETILLKLQKEYRNGEIKEEDMTEEQINSLCVLYDKQIANLRKSNDFRKKKLLEHRRR